MSGSNAVLRIVLAISFLFLHDSPIAYASSNLLLGLGLMRPGIH
jgi:hypothetical protein